VRYFEAAFPKYLTYIESPPLSNGEGGVIRYSQNLAKATISPE
jgi:hypothetical protein